jgi:Na+-transporting NADH:ubiquinone oxidoreductase subunit F
VHALVHMTTPALFKGIVEQKTLLHPTLFLVRLRITEGGPLAFRAGQYLDFSDAPPSGDRSTLLFSIASAPSQAPQVDLLVSVYSEGKRAETFRALAEGEEVAFSAPYGTFGLAPSSRPLSFIAAQSGVAPFRSMMFEQLRDEGFTGDFTLYFITSLGEQSDDLVREFQELAERDPRFHFFPLQDITLQKDGQFERDLEQLWSVLDAKSEVARSREYYLCGGGPLRRTVEAHLLASGIDASAIHYENFA